MREGQREALLRARLLAVHGVWQRDVDSGGEVRHLIAQRMTDLTPLLGRLGQHRSGSNGLGVWDIAAARGHEQGEEAERYSFHAVMMRGRPPVGKQRSLLGSSVVR